MIGPGKPAEQSLREQAALLDQAQRVGRMGSWRLDVRSGRLTFPEATCDLFGITPAEFRGTIEHFRSFIIPEDLPAFDAPYARLAADTPLIEAEYRIRRADGALRCMYARGQVEVDAAGVLVGALGIVMDITEHRAAREQLAETAALLRIAGRVARLGGWRLQLPDRTLIWSDENCAIHDVPPGYLPTFEEGVGYYPAECRAEVLRHVEACERDGTPYDFELPKLTATGRSIWVRSIGEAVRDASGRIVALQGAFQDITERRRAEEALRQKDALMRIAGRVTRTGGWRVEMPGQQVFWSDEVFDIVDYPRGTVPPLAAALALYVDGSREVITAAVGACLEQGTPFDVEVEILTSRQARKWVRVCGEAERRTDGSIKRAQGAFQDITERKQLEQQYLRARRMETIGTLAGGIAHDLNNVLTPILLSTRLLQEGEVNAERLDTLSTIEIAATRGAAMVSRVMAFARGVKGTPVEIRLEAMVRELVKEIRETFPADVRVEPRIRADVWPLRADPAQLHQVLLSLCANARDAMPAGGRLTIAAGNVRLDEDAARDAETAAGAYVKIDVIDTGTGIAKDILDKIFDPFFTTRALGKGTGLGLATALAIVKGHHGFIRAYSEPDAGTRVSFYLPVLAGAIPDVVAARAPAAPMGNGETILVVDDEPLIRRIAKRTLEAWGYRVLLAADGSEAVARYLEHRADVAVVLTDMMMPVMDGPATIEALARLNPEVRIIGASGLAADDDVLEVGGVSYPLVAKPYSAETLRRALRAALA